MRSHLARFARSPWSWLAVSLVSFSASNCAKGDLSEPDVEKVTNTGTGGVLTTGGTATQTNGNVGGATNASGASTAGTATAGTATAGTTTAGTASTGTASTGTATGNATAGATTASAGTTGRGTAGTTGGTATAGTASAGTGFGTTAAATGLGSTTSTSDSTTGSGTTGSTAPPPPCQDCKLRIQVNGTAMASAYTGNLILGAADMSGVGDIGMVTLPQVTIRYWFADSAMRQWEVDYWPADATDPMKQNIKYTYGSLATPVPGADHYLEISFPAKVGGMDSPLANVYIVSTGMSKMQFRFHRPDYSNADYTSDYSYTPSVGTTFTDAPKITAYINGVLEWGTEPGGSASPAPTSTTGGGAASATGGGATGGGATSATGGGTTGTTGSDGGTT